MELDHRLLCELVSDAKDLALAKLHTYTSRDHQVRDRQDPGELGHNLYIAISNSYFKDPSLQKNGSQLTEHARARWFLL